MAHLGALISYLGVIIAYLGALMADLGALIADMVDKWNMDSYILLRIQFLMGFLVFLYYLILTSILYFSTRLPRVKLLESGSEILLVYIMGAMQVAPFKNEMFPVWALLLVSFRSSINFLSRHNTEFEVVNIMKLGAVILLSLKHGTKSWGIPFWSFWVVMALKSLYRFLAHRGASDNLWYGPSSEILHEYMGTDQGCNDLLVYGEPNKSNMSEQSATSTNEDLRSDEEENRSLMTGQRLSMDESGTLITLDKICRHGDGGGMLLNNIINRRNNMKDVTLAFAMSRLLRCRLEGATLQAETIKKTQGQINSGILLETGDNSRILGRGNAEKLLFGVLKVEASLLAQHLHTDYPLIFWQGFLSLSFHTIVFFLTCISYLWLLREIRTPNRTEQPRVNADVRITLGAMIVMAMVDYVEIVTFVGSYWTSLLIVRKYVNTSKTWMRVCLEILMLFSAAFRGIVFEQLIMVRFTSHYDLLQSSKYSSRELKPVAIKVGWAERLFAGKHFEDVITSVIRSAVSPERHNVMNTEVRHIPLLSPSDTYWSASLQLGSCSHVILVWHIATSLCEIQLAEERGTTTRELYYLKRGSPLNEELRRTHLVAECLSRYCLYLLMSKPNLLPGNTFASKKILRETIEHAYQMLEVGDSPSRQSQSQGLAQSTGWFEKMLLGFGRKMLQDFGRKMLQGRHWLKSNLQTWSSFHQEFQQELQARYDMLTRDAVTSTNAVIGENRVIKLSGNVVQQGAILAKELMVHEGEKRRWEILANIWADLIVHIAPSSKVDAHRKDLEDGTELLTLIWELLCHCGIEKSELWPDDAEAGGTLREHLDKLIAARERTTVPAPSPPSPAAPASNGQGPRVVRPEV